MMRSIAAATRTLGRDPKLNGPVSTSAGTHYDAETSRANAGSRSAIVDLADIPALPWVWVDERVYAAIRGCSIKVLQRERRLNTGCRFRRINGTTIRYKLGDIWSFMESQPAGGAGTVPSAAATRRRAGRPRRRST